MARTPALAILALPLLGLITAGDRVRYAGLDFWNAMAAQAEFEDTDAHARALEAHRQEVGERFAASRLVLDRLAAGDLTLAAAAAELEGVFRDWPEYLEGIRTYYPGATDRERFARSLAHRLRVSAGAEPGRYAAAADRAEAELETLYPPGSAAAGDEVR
jgi:hypothetical protein